jgi:hypothetical protein
MYILISACQRWKISSVGNKPCAVIKYVLWGFALRRCGCLIWNFIASSVRLIGEWWVEGTWKEAGVSEVGCVALHVQFLCEIGTGQPKKMRCRYTIPLQCGMLALTAKPECISVAPALCSAKSVHLQQNPNAFPLHQPSVVRNVCAYSKTRMHFRYTSPL